MFVLSITLFSSLTRAQFIPVPTDARRAAMGGVTMEYGRDSLRIVGIGHRQGYLMSGMATRSLHICWPVGRVGEAKARYLHFGDADYHEQQLAGAYRMQLSRAMIVGVGARYCFWGTSDVRYEPHHWLAFSVLACWSVSSRVCFATQLGSRPWDAGRPWNMHLGMQYCTGGGLATLLEVESEEAWRFRAGVEYCYAQRYLFRCGLATRPLSLTFGMGFHLRNWSLDLSVENYQPLGLTPQISAALCF